MSDKRSSLVLGIETSCDDTAIAVVRGGREVLSNVVHSQISLHAAYSGVVPEIASRSHLQRILPLYRMALQTAGVRAEELNAIAVTHRPGLIGCLLVGLSVAKTLCLVTSLPLIAVDHLQAHVYSAFMTEPELDLPLLSLVASGGHTGLYLVEREGSATLLGRSLDDAAGEAFDKAAAMLGLSYPGGPSIEGAAANGNPAALSLPRSSLGKDSLDFSFSGLKTALLYHLRGPGLTREMPVLGEQERADLAASFQEAVVDNLVLKLERALALTGARSIAIGGGVARNLRLREKLAAKSLIATKKLVLPPLELCSDNGAMVAGLGALRHAEGHVAGLELEAFARSESKSS